MQVGLIGLGRMGMAMVRRFVEGGDEVVGWDLDPGRIAEAAALGMTVATGPGDVASRVSITLSMVTDDAAVEQMVDGPQGILAGDVDGKLLVEMSTVRPAFLRTLDGKLKARGARLVGAPVLGSIPTVRDGKLLVLAGGAAEDVDRARPVLDRLARAVVHVGPVGAGNAMKLVVNLSMGAYLQALAEGLALGRSQGLSLDAMLDILGQAPTANGWLAAKLPVLRGGTADTTLDIAALRKDIMSAVSTGAAAGVPMLLASGVLGALSAAVAAGQGHADLAELPRFFRDSMVQESASRLGGGVDGQAA